MNTKMKLLATGAAALVASFQAQAFGPTQAPDIIFYTGGAAAQANSFQAFAAKLMTSFDVYTDAACGTAGKNYRAVYGTIGTTLPDGSAIPASLVGKKVFVEYGDNGGAFINGIDGIARSHAIQLVNFINAQGANNTVACGAGSSTQYSTAVSGTTTVATHIPLLGFSDQESTLFVGANLPAGSTALTAAELGKVNSTPLYESVYGVAENSLLAAQKTNFTTAEVAAIEAGFYKNWNQLKGDVGAFNGVALPAGGIVLIDRNAGSGTKAAANQYFLHNPGSKAFGGNVAPKTGSANIGDCTGYTVYSDCVQSTAGAVVSALNAANAAGARAVGILDMSNQPGASDHYTYASLNSVDIQGITAVTCGNAVANPFEPAQVVSGAYDFYFSNTLNFRIANVGGQPFEGDGSVSSDFIDAYNAVASDPATEVSVPGQLLDPDVAGTPAGNPWDSCITKGTRHQNSTAPVQLTF